MGFNLGRSLTDDERRLVEIHEANLLVYGNRYNEAYSKYNQLYHKAIEDDDTKHGTLAERDKLWQYIFDLDTAYIEAKQQIRIITEGTNYKVMKDIMNGQ